MGERLYRPVGMKELKLIFESGMKAFPPRLPEQPIFYPVLKLDYAIAIARDWNAKHNDDKCGFVTMFEVEESYVSQFKTEQVGGSLHKELWVPAEELEAFNHHIEGIIQVIDAFYGEGYDSKQYDFKDKIISEQLKILQRMYE